MDVAADDGKFYQRDCDYLVDIQKRGLRQRCRMEECQKRGLETFGGDVSSEVVTMSLMQIGTLTVVTDWDCDSGDGLGL